MLGYVHGYGTGDGSLARLWKAGTAWICYSRTWRVFKASRICACTTQLCLKIVEDINEENWSYTRAADALSTGERR